MHSDHRLFRSALRFSPCLLLAGSLGTLACGSTPPPSGTGGTSSGGSGAAPSTGGASSSGGGSSTGGASSGGAPSTGGASSGGAPSSGGAGSGGAGSGGDGSGGDGSGGGSQAVFTCPEGSESMAPTLSGTPEALPGTLPAAPGPNGTESIMEGPVWIDGALYMSQMRNYGPLNPANLLKHDGSNYSIFLPDSLTNGLALRADGMILAASHGVGGLVEIDPAASSPRPTTGTADYMGSRLNSPNDLVIRADGNVYFTDPDYQCDSPCDDQPDNRVYFYPAAGGPLQAIETGHQNPNGITLSLDGTKLYVAGGGGIEVYSLDPTSGAVTAGPDPFNDTAMSNVDGLSIDCAGNIYAAAAGELTVLDPDGAQIGQPITVPNSTTNVAFGGASGTTLYITTMSQAGVYTLDVGIPGSPY